MPLPASSARVLPSVPHQERLRGDRAEHLPPQPRIRSHVLGVGGGARSAEAWRKTGGKRRKQDLTSCGKSHEPLHGCSDR